MKDYDWMIGFVIGWIVYEIIKFQNYNLTVPITFLLIYLIIELKTKTKGGKVK